MLGRIGLFLLTNMLVLVTVSVVINLLGVGPYLSEAGINYEALLTFCLVWGMLGSFISLSMSRFLAKMMMRVKVLEPGGAGAYEWYVNLVYDLAKRASLPQMPQVGIYESADVNAFATGPTKSRSLVAVSTGLLSSMSREEIEGVLGHEITHISNGDMVTMTLIQGVVNSFVIFFSRIIAHVASQAVKEEMAHAVRIGVTILLDICFGILGSMVTAWFSRRREFRADNGSAGLVGREKMIAALERLKKVDPSLAYQEAEEAQAIAALKISGKSSGFLALLATHPPLEQRIEALKAYARNY